MHSSKEGNLTFQDSGANSLKKWFLAIRPATLFASISPVLVGTSMAYKDGVFHLPSALAAAIGAIFIQIGTNLANDYYDFVHGVDHEGRLGPVRVTQKGIIDPDSVRRGFIIAFIVAILAGIYLILRGGMPIFIIGVLSIIFGITYSAGPFPTGYYGLADPLVIIFFGPVAVGGTYYVQALSINGKVLIAGLGPGLISNAILTVNNLRDWETDKLAGKKSLAVRFGKGFARGEYILSIAAAFIIPIFLISSNHHYHLICWGAFLLCLSPMRIIWEEPSGLYNKLLKSTAMLLFAYSLLFSIGWIAG